MTLGRRDFLKGFAGVAGLTFLQPSGMVRPTVTSTDSGSQSDVALLVDVSKCIGCWWCYAACKNYNNLPETIKPDPEDPPKLSGDCWTTLFALQKGDGWSFRKQACMHCTDAACVEVCPSGALRYNELGFVQYETEKCIGCGYCVEYCPFNVPRLESNRITGIGLMHKCTFCMERVTSHQQPACADACPTGAIKFGRRLELVQEGKQRVAVSYTHLTLPTKA